MREALADPLLGKYSVIILDDVHERTLETDTLFGILNKIATQRSDFRVIITSAVPEMAQLASRLGASCLFVPERANPVEIHYVSEQISDFFDKSIETVVKLHSTEPKGDILLFLPDEETVEKACQFIQKEINKEKNSEETIVIPFHSVLSQCLETKGRKIVVATSIAETLLPFDGIVYVVDSGFTQQRVFNNQTLSESLLLKTISKEAAQLRANCVGRNEKGKCFRLYSENTFKVDFPQQTCPEIFRSNLEHTVVQLKKFGVDDLAQFTFIDSPTAETLKLTFDRLKSFRILDENEKLTKNGTIVADFPLSPQLTMALVAASHFHCSEEVLTIVSLLSVSQIFLHPFGKEKEALSSKAKFVHNESDHLTLLNVYLAYKKNQENGNWCLDNFLHERSLKTAQHIRVQLEVLMKRFSIPLNSIDVHDKLFSVNIRKALACGFSFQVAKLEKDGNYRILKSNQIVTLHPSSCCFASKPNYLFFNDFVLSTSNCIQIASQIEPEWVEEVSKVL